MTLRKSALHECCDGIHFFPPLFRLFVFLSRYGKGEFVRGTVLVFLPGLPEINRLKEKLPRDLE